MNFTLSAAFQNSKNKKRRQTVIRDSPYSWLRDREGVEEEDTVTPEQSSGSDVSSSDDSDEEIKVHHTHHRSQSPSRVFRTIMTSRVLFRIFQVWAVAAVVLLIALVNHRQSRYMRMRHGDIPKSRTKTTLVLMGYSTNRLENYDRILPAYSDMDDVIDKIIFLWNNQVEEPPKVPMHGKVPIILIREPENSMNNRFGPDVTERTKTDVVTLVDDDCLLSRGMIRAMISSWETSSPYLEQRSLIGVDGDGRIVGPEDGYLFPCNRIEGWILQRHCWKSIVSSSTPVSNKPLNLVVGKTMTFSTRFMLAYQNDGVVWNYTSPQGGHFCEDIMMNALIRNATNNRDPVLMAKDPKWSLRGKNSGANGEHLAMDQTRTILTESGGLSFSLTVLSWNDKRSNCVRWASTHYGEDVWEERNRQPSL